MKDYSGIIQDIKDNITENGKGEITGRDLREILLEAIGNVSVDMGELDRRIEAILGGENYDDIINSWAELEQFLSGLDESSNLVELLSYKADKDQVYSRSDINTKLEDYTKTDDLGALALKDEVEMSDIKNLEDALDKKLDKEGGEIENNLLVKGELKMGVLFLPTGDGEPSSYRLTIGELGEGADIPSSGEGSLGSVTIMLGDVPYYSDSNGIVRLPAYPTGGGGVSGDYLLLSGGEIKAGDNQTPLIIDNTNTTLTQVRIQTNNENKANVGWSGYTGFTGYRLGVFLHSVVASSSIGIKDDGTPYYNNNTLLHTGNIGSYAPIYNANGDISITGSIIPNSTAYNLGSSTYYWDMIYTDKINTGSGRALKIYTDGTERLRLNAAGTSFYPSVGNNIMGLGTVENRWSAIYSHTGNFAAAITLSGTASSTVASINYTRVGANYITFPSGGNFRITVGAASDANTALLIYTNKNVECRGNIYASGYQLPTSAPSNPVSGGYYLYVGTLGSGAVIS